jgi:hypothetical protein
MIRNQKKRGLTVPRTFHKESRTPALRRLWPNKGLEKFAFLCEGHHIAIAAMRLA